MENNITTGISGIETAPPEIFELKCDCGEVCGKIEFPAGTVINREELSKTHTTVCDKCGDKNHESL